MLKNNLFFVYSPIKRFSFSSYNMRVLRSLKPSRSIYYFDISRFLDQKGEKKNYKSIVRPINFELLTVFYVVVMSGSITKAAKHLSVTQPSISLSLRKIEKETGFLLFKNLSTKKRTILTSYGSIIFNHIERLFSLIEESFELSKLSVSSRYSNNLSQLNSKNLTLFSCFNSNQNKGVFVRERKVSSNNFFKNYFINLNRLNFSYFENESRFILKKGAYINLKNFHRLKFNNSSNITFFFDKSSSLKIFNNRMLFFFDNFNIIEIQTKVTFNICVEMKISNILFWGSEI